jgi:hypothetical protein
MDQADGCCVLSTQVRVSSCTCPSAHWHGVAVVSTLVCRKLLLLYMDYYGVRQGVQGSGTVLKLVGYYVLQR